MGTQKTTGWVRFTFFIVGLTIGVLFYDLFVLKSGFLKIFNNISPEWTAILLSFLISIFGFFKDQITHLLFKPKLDIEFDVISPNCHKTKKMIYGSNASSVDCYYYRLLVRSLNNISPLDLEMMILKKFDKVGDNFREDKSFLPMSLLWSHYRTSIINNIPPKLFKFCDFGSIVPPILSDELTRSFLKKVESGEILLDLDLAVRPYTGSSFVTEGVYRFEIALTGKNFKIIKRIFQVNLPKYWSVNEEEMLTKGLTVEKI